MYRELQEEVGLQSCHVQILGRTREWIRYEVPQHWVKREWRGSYKGQKQIWFLLRLVGRDCDVSLRASVHPEFDAWRWNDYWVEMESVIEFKRDVYRLALNELVRYLRQPIILLAGMRPKKFLIIFELPPCFKVSHTMMINMNLSSTIDGNLN